MRGSEATGRRPATLECETPRKLPEAGCVAYEHRARPAQTKATFFMVGQMGRAYPWMVRRVYDEGHTVANHTQNHPVRKMSVTQAAREIEEGFASLREAIGDPQAYLA